MMKLPLQKMALIGFVVAITAFNAAELLMDYFSENESLTEVALEAVLVLITTWGVIYLIRSLYLRQRDLSELSVQLKETKHALNSSRKRLTKVSEAFSVVINEQYDDWKLSPSEKEVASLLLKGLRFDEIAVVRNAKEKTARQQASAIYRKSGLNGRHEFAAWFFEDLL